MPAIPARSGSRLTAGLLLGRWLLPHQRSTAQASSADEAESATEL